MFLLFYSFDTFAKIPGFCRACHILQQSFIQDIYIYIFFFGGGGAHVANIFVTSGLELVTSILEDILQLKDLNN